MGWSRPKPYSKAERIQKEEARLKKVAEQIRLQQEREAARRAHLERIVAASAADPLRRAPPVAEPMAEPATAPPERKKRRRRTQKPLVKDWLIEAATTRRLLRRKPGEDIKPWTRRLFAKAQKEGVPVVSAESLETTIHALYRDGILQKPG
jgi:hypothetical protein